MSLTSNMEEDIQNYSPTVLFRGTLCISHITDPPFIECTSCPIHHNNL